MYKAPVRNHLVSLGACVFLFLDLIPESTFSYSLAIFFFLFYCSCIECPSLWIRSCIYLFIHAFFSFFYYYSHVSLFVDIGRFFFIIIIYCVFYMCMGVYPSRAGSVSGWCRSMQLTGRCERIKGRFRNLDTFPRELLERISRTRFLFRLF